MRKYLILLLLINVANAQNYRSVFDTITTEEVNTKNDTKTLEICNKDGKVIGYQIGDKLPYFIEPKTLCTTNPKFKINLEDLKNLKK